jgi:hypothetical protein
MKTVCNNSIFTSNNQHSFFSIANSKNGEVQNHILESTIFYSFFENCIGALDGSHIPAFVPTTESAVFRNRKDFISQNTLCLVNFDMMFCYAHV